MTGGSGFIGTHMIKRLEADHDVFNLDIVAPFSPGKSTFIKCDLSNPSDIESAFSKIGKIDAVIHLAAVSREAISNQQPDFYFNVNVVGTFNLLHAAQKAGIKKFLFASSYLVYGNTGNNPVPESHSLGAMSIYASTKLACEAFCESFTNIYGMQTVIFRQALAYGENDMQKRVVTLFIERAKEGKDITVFGNKVLDLVYVGDIVDAYVRALSYEKSDIFNLASGRGTSLLEIANSVRDSINPNIKVVQQEAKLGEVTTFIADISKISKTLGYSPKGNLTDFIRSQK